MIASSIRGLSLWPIGHIVYLRNDKLFLIDRKKDFPIDTFVDEILGRAVD